MHDFLESLAQGVVIASFVATAFSYVVLKPMNAVIEELKEAVLDLRREMAHNEDAWATVKERLIRVEESVKSAHKRIDRMEGRE